MAQENNLKKKIFTYIKSDIYKIMSSFVRFAGKKLRHANLRRLLAGLAAGIISMVSICAAAAPGQEAVQNTYRGINGVEVVLNNIDYDDVRNSDTWAKEAIYESGALNLLKGYGDRVFGLNNTVTKEQAIAIAYRLAGREEDAQVAAEEYYNEEGQASPINPIRYWSDGYLILAANEGLISDQDLEDAFGTGTQRQTGEFFYRDAEAERQEIAYWMAKALMLEPIYDQQKIFNSYIDWQEADPQKIPYIEAILQANIMNGDGSGRFSPRGPLTREQVAQIIKNAEDYILPILEFSKNTGTIEEITVTNDMTSGTAIERRTFNIRNVNGKLDKITVESAVVWDEDKINESNAQRINEIDRDTVVYKNGTIGRSDLLQKGDRIQYITAPDMTVRFIRVYSSVLDTKYIVAQINNVNSKSMQIDVTQFFMVDGPNPEMINSGFSLDMTNERVNGLYNLSSGISIFKNGKKADLSAVEVGSHAILTITNNMVTAINVFEYTSYITASKVVKGIVEENNPKLGYITLYNEDGAGTNPDTALQLLRTYNYAQEEELKVYKNHSEATADSIEVGDTVFIKLDENNDASEISAVSNYSVKYARIVSKKEKVLAVEYEDGTSQVLDIDSSIPVISNRKIISYNALKDGDRVRLILHITNKFTAVKEIVLEDNGALVSNVYKGEVVRVDNMSGEMLVKNTYVLKGNKWQPTDIKGITRIGLADDFLMYSNSQKIDASRANNYLSGTEAYIVVKKDYSGKEKAVFVSYRNEMDKEAEPYDDTITYVSGLKGEIRLSKASSNFAINNDTIVIKYGRLVSPGSISGDDVAYVVANRSYDSGEYYASVINIDDRWDMDSVQIYRARIKSIVPNKEFTVESYSVLKGLEWEYANTPKTFKLNADTRITDEDGIINQRNFVSYGTDSYKGQVVYIVANDINAVYISTAPYGTSNITGEIYQIAGGTIGEEGTIIEEPTQIALWQTKVYDTDDYMWKEAEDMSLNIMKNTVILKNNQIIKPSELKKGDRIRVIKKDDDESSDAYIIIVMN